MPRKKKTCALNNQSPSSNWSLYWLSTKRKGGVVEPKESRDPFLAKYPSSLLDMDCFV